MAEDQELLEVMVEGLRQEGGLMVRLGRMKRQVWEERGGGH